MAIPIVLGLAGLFAAREGVRGIRNTGFRNALPSIADQLPPEEQAVVQGLATGGPFGIGGNSKAAFDYAILARTNEQNEAWRAQQIDFRNAQLNQQRLSYDLAVDAFDQRLLEYDDAKQLRQNERALMLESLTNPQLAQFRAAQNGQDQYAQVIDGAMRMIPVAGTQAWNEPVARANVRSTLINNINELVSLVETDSADLTDPESTAAARYRSLQASITGDIKDAESLGALDEGVLNFANLLVPDATTFAANYFGSRDVIRSQLQTTMQRYQGRLQEDVALMRGFQGVPDAFANRWATALGMQSTSTQAAIAQDRARQEAIDANVGATAVSGARSTAALALEFARSAASDIGRLFGN